MANAYVNDFTTTVQLYYQDIKSFKPLTREREIELIVKAKSNDKEATEQIVKSNLKFVVDVAKRYTGRGASMDDLISEGNIGLLQAIKKFDEKQNVKFISYAVWWIKQAMLSFIANAQAKANREYYGEEALNVSLENNTLYDENYMDDVAKKDAIYDYENLDEKKHELRDIVNALMIKLSKREKTILEYRFGINGRKELSLQEIGETMKLSKERVRQILVKTLRKLRTEVLMNDEMLKIFN